MVKKCPALVLAWIAACVSAAFADTIQLKDRAAVTGRILAEKRDQVIVDLGFTVLTVPRSQVVRIVREEEILSAKKARSSPVSRVSQAVSDNPRFEDPLISTRVLTPEGPRQDAILDPVPGPAAFYASSRLNRPLSSVRELVHELGESVVQVRTPSSLGSGFLINEEGFLITNFHVIEGETQISVEVYHQRNGQLDRKSYRRVAIVAMNKFQDLALLKIEDPGAPKFQAVTFGSAEALAVGEKVFAIGSPLGLERTVTEGIVSTKTRQMQGELYMQTTAQINPGNSGGPLFNLMGEVVGVTNMKITFGEGLGFAIPVEAVRFFLDHRDAFAYSSDNPSNAYRYLDPPRRARHGTLAPDQAVE